MLPVAEARQCVLERAGVLPAAAMPLTHAALGRVLAEDVASDLDMPPFDKALMDGYAVRAGDLDGGRGTLVVIEEVQAGQVPTKTLAAGQATRIMTGAPIPAGADAVVPHERTRSEAGRVSIDDLRLTAEQFILRRGREMRTGDVVLPAGTVLRPAELGVLATVGRTTAKVIPAPRVAVIATGDELIDPGGKPGPGQIRNSNAPMLLAQAARAGGAVRDLGIGRDAVDSLRPLIGEALRTADVVVLSGGVSEGKKDLVPAVLQELGVVPHFHKVRLKPGKPLFFGTREGVLVFGLPGNPVSSLVCFELFIRPALRRLAGHGADPACFRATMAEDFTYRTDRPTYHPARVEIGEGGWRVQPVPWFGSADLRALVRANALVLLAEGEGVYPAGQGMEVWRLD